MNKKCKVTISLIIIGCIIGCTQNEKSYHEISIDINQPKVTITSEIFKDIKFIPLETIKEYPIGEITVLKIINDRFYIYDDISKILFIYNKSGEYINHIQNIGKGPGEYKYISDFQFIENKIVLLTNRRELLYFTADGSFIKQKNFTFFCDYFVKTNQNKILTLSEANTYNHHLLRVNNKMNIMDKYLKFKDKARKYSLWPDPALKKADSVMMYIPEDYSLYTYKNKQLNKAFKINFTNIMPDAGLRNKNDFTTKDLEKMPLIKDYFFLSDQIILSFAYKSFAYEYIYSPQNKKGKLINSVQLKDDINQLPKLPVFFIGVDNNHLYGKISAHAFRINIKKSKNSKLKKRFLHKTENSHNPIIVQYTPKKFQN